MKITTKPSRYSIWIDGKLTVVSLVCGKGWKVTDARGDVLSKTLDGKYEWEWEPQPSNRDEAFLKRTRFSNEYEAERAFTSYIKESPMEYIATSFVDGL